MSLDLAPRSSAPQSAAASGADVSAPTTSSLTITALPEAYAPEKELSNEDIAPLRRQSWSSYNFFAFWMSDVHSVGGYVTAGSLFALGLASWQVLVALVLGIVIVQVFVNLVAKPSQVTGVPYPVVNRAIFGIRGANIPAIIRGIIAVAWYGVQTYLASESLSIVFLKFWPQLAPLNDAATHGFMGLSALGYICYGILWVAQAALFWRGIDSIRKFIDWAGPAVYLVMIALCVYLVAKAGLHRVSLNLSGSKPLGFKESIPVMLSAIALVVSYFSGPMLNFGDLARFGKSFQAVKKGNFWGLPFNFMFFSLLTVVTASATVPVFGRLITDPIKTVEAIDTPFAILLGGFTFVLATIGINIVANFIAPAFDFSHVNPQKISWRTGGMIAAVGSVLLTPWNWYSNDLAIHFTLDSLGGLIGPLFGILIAGFYMASRQCLSIEHLYTRSPQGMYWYRNGFNPNAVWALVIGGVPALLAVVGPNLLAMAGAGSGLAWVSNYSWFIGCGLGFAGMTLLEKVRPMIPVAEACDETQAQAREEAALELAAQGEAAEAPVLPAPSAAAGQEA